MQQLWIGLVVSVCLVFPAQAGVWHVYIGTYTRGESRGIYYCRLVTNPVRLTDPTLAANTEDPSFLAVHPTAPVLVCVNEVPGPGYVSSFRVLSGRLSPVAKRPANGVAPCHLAFSPDGSLVAIANYGSGSLALFRATQDGELNGPIQVVQHQGSGADPRRQERPHAHAVLFTPDGRHLFAADLGADSIFVYAVDSERGSLRLVASAKTAPGAGPRHLTLHPNGQYLYVINELNSTVDVLRWDPTKATLRRLQTVSTLPPGTTVQNTTAEIVVHPTGRWLYGSNRGHDSIVTYRVLDEGARIEPLGWQPTGGRTPRNFALSPDGRFLLAANQATDNVVLFRIDEQTGLPRPSGRSIRVPAPVCVLFVPPSAVGR